MHSQSIISEFRILESQGLVRLRAPSLLAVARKGRPIYPIKSIQSMSRKNEVFIQLPTEPSYWGSEATATDVSRICDNLESMISAEFGEHTILTFERTATPLGEGVFSAHEETAQEVWNWIANNWTSAL